MSDQGPVQGGRGRTLSDTFRSIVNIVKNGVARERREIVLFYLIRPQNF